MMKISTQSRCSQHRSLKGGDVFKTKITRAKNDLNRIKQESQTQKLTVANAKEEFRNHDAAQTALPKQEQSIRTVVRQENYRKVIRCQQTLPYVRRTSKVFLADSWMADPEKKKAIIFS